jgi:hypothetical protein
VHWQEGANAGDGYLVARNPNWGSRIKHEAFWYFGLCEVEPEQLVAHLVTLQRFREMADRVELSDRARRISLEDFVVECPQANPLSIAAVLRGEGSEYAPEDLAVPDPIPSTMQPRAGETSKEKPLINAMLAGAIWQALAGRTQGSPDTVLDRTRDIFQKMLEQLRKRLQYAERNAEDLNFDPIRFVDALVARGGLSKHSVDVEQLAASLPHRQVRAAINRELRRRGHAPIRWPRRKK